jgi:predicted molibdopterin-dependent oxidoreductase YjgC
MLPAAPPLEKDGHFTDWEGRGQRLNAVRGPKRLARADWEIFAELAKALGGNLGFATLDELHEEMGKLLAPRESAAAPDASNAAGPSAGLTLFTYPLLVDAGRLLQGADELKATQQADAFVEVNPEDAAALGVEDGASVKVKTAAGSATLPVRVTDNVAKGAVFVPFNQPGLAANALLDGEFSVPVALEGGS